MKPIRLPAFGLLALTACAPAAAAELDITAQFRPSAAEPNITRFVNTTPLSGYCHGNSSHCDPGDFTIMTPLQLERMWQAPGPTENQNYQRVDGAWQTVTVYSETRSEPFDVNFRVNLLARRYDLGALQPGGISGEMSTVANGSGINGASSGGCRGRVGGGHATMYEFAWDVPEGWRACSREHRSNLELGPYLGNISSISIGYELVAPNPMQLPNGTYTGQARYSVGEGRQIDLGPGTYNDELLNINFTLTVEHQIRVEFPAGSDRVQLEPDNGWLDWLNKGRRPTRLYREQPFRLWASAPLHMYLLCEHTLGNRCGIAETRTGDPVPVDISVSLPDAFRHQGQLVQKIALPVGKPSALTFDAVRPLLSGRSLLHYSVAADQVNRMLDNHGSTYKGNVTIIFDAQI